MMNAEIRRLWEKGISILGICVVFLGCYTNSQVGVSWNDKKVQLDKEVFAPIIDYYGKSTFSYCEFFELYAQIRSDSTLFEQVFVNYDTFHLTSRPISSKVYYQNIAGVSDTSFKNRWFKFYDEHVRDTVYFYNLPSDSFRVYAKRNSKVESNLIGAIVRITDISTSRTGTIAGYVYRKDTSFYNDVFRWGCKLGCIPCDDAYRLEFIAQMDSMDLSHNRAFVNRARLRNWKDTLSYETFPVDSAFHYLESKF